MTVVLGDCLDVMRGMEPGSVDLVYLDPPFMSGRDYIGTTGEFKDRWSSMEEYLDFIRDRLVEVNRILHPKTGSVYLHCDDTACHRLRCVMDDVFGVSAFRSHIAWRRSKSKNDAVRAFGRISDIILHYALPDATFNPQFKPLDPEYIKNVYRYDDGDGRGPYSSVSIRSPRFCPSLQYKFRGYSCHRNGWTASRATMEKWHEEGRLIYPKRKDGRIRKKVYLSQSKGIPVGNIWDDIPNVMSGSMEAVGYPTQKPVALLERIISASSNPGDMVFDPFCGGGGTTLVAAARLGRKFSGCDISPDAIAASRKRLDEEADLFTGTGDDGGP